MNIFDTVRIKGVTLPNRLLMAPVKTAFGDTGGKVTDRLIHYYRRRAEGGVGAVIVEPLYVDGTGKEHPKQLGIDADDKVAGLSRLVSAIHDGGAKVFAHLNHAGRAANPKASGRPPEAPSEIICPSTGAEALEMSETRIEEINEAFARAARRAREAGFDGVEIQCGLGYLVAQFLSPLTNRRQDGYGGSREGRERFARQVVRAVRDVVGPDFPLTARISATEQVEGGLGLADGRDLAEKLVQWGIDAIHVVSGSACDTPPWYYQHMSLPEGKNEEFAATIRDGLGVPVIVAGRLGEPERIARVLDEGQADMIALGRPLVADPDFPSKMRDGREDEIMLCGGCLQGCLASVKSGEGISCIVNPRVGHETELDGMSTHPCHVVVVGGGPAGMMTAVVAGESGHRVTLLEKGLLGGQFALSFLAPGKEALVRPFSSLVNSARNSGADIRTATEATVDLVAGLDPDLVVLATGAKPIIPNIQGLEKPVTGNAVLDGQVETGKRVLVLGGGLVGIEVAEFLAIRDHEVVVVEMLEEIARDMEMITRKMTMKRLQQMPVEIHTGTALVRMEGSTAIVADDSGEHELGVFDTVVVTVGTRSDDALSLPLTEKGIEVRVVGDAASLEQVMGAVRSGWEAGRSA